MPESSIRHRNPDSGRGSTTRVRSQDRIRPRPYRRSSSYDDLSHHQRHREERRPRRSRYHDEDSDYYSSSSSSPAARPLRRQRVASSSLPPNRRRRSRNRDTSSNSDDRDDGGGQISRERRDQAIKAAVTAGAVEAFRQRNRPGEWLGKKGLRVATAAMSAAAIDSAVDKNPRRKGVRNVMGSTLGGLVVDQLANGMQRG